MLILELFTGNCNWPLPSLPAAPARPRTRKTSSLSSSGLSEAGSGCTRLQATVGSLLPTSLETAVASK